MKNHKNELETQSPAFLVGTVMPSCLRLPLKTKWFEMTKAGIKTEDYREINDYWISRLCYSEFSLLQSTSFNMNINGYWYSKKTIEINKMTLGYPKSTDTDRILKLEHKGIEIRTGNPEWGAVPDKLYFVVKHGAVLA